MWEHLGCRCPSEDHIYWKFREKICCLRGSPNLHDLRNYASCIPYVVCILNFYKNPYPPYLSLLFKIVVPVAITTTVAPHRTLILEDWQNGIPLLWRTATCSMLREPSSCRVLGHHCTQFVTESIHQSHMVPMLLSVSTLVQSCILFFVLFAVHSSSATMRPCHW
jgi:hypothetical protein